MKRLIAVLMCACAVAANAQPRAASYAKQSSGGYPLIAAGRIDTAAVQYLAKFDDVTLEAAPWAMNVNGAPRADVPLMLRQLNPRIRLWLYTLAGDFWLPPTFVPQANDRSAYREQFDAVNAGNGWLYGTDGALWFPDYRVNLADSATVRRLGDLYVRLVSLRLWDAMFLDDCHTSIAWTTPHTVLWDADTLPVLTRFLDVRRAGFRSVAAMDSARLANVTRLVARVRAAGGCGFLVAMNGTGPVPPNVQVQMREGLGTLISEAEATDWMARPGLRWMKAECYSPAECEQKRAMLLRCANGRGIVSLGPDRGWPAVLVK